MSNNRRNAFTARRIALDAVLIAIYVVLATIGEHLEIAGVRITVSTLPVLIAAIAFGIVDSTLVGFLGEFIAQMIAWGLSWGSLLWCVPHTLYGLVLGILALMLPNYFSVEAVDETFANKGTKKINRVIGYYLVCIVGAVVASVSNTLVYYVDSVVNHYYSYEIVFGVLWIRIVLGIATAIVIGTISAPLIIALKRNHLIKTSDAGVNTGKSMFTTRTLVFISVLAAISVVLARLIIPMPAADVRYSIEAVPIVIAGMLFGPVAGAMVGFVADLVGCLFSGYGYMPLFALPPILYGVIPGLLSRWASRDKLNRDVPNFWKILIMLIIPAVIGSILWQSFPLSLYYGAKSGKGYWVYVLSRIPQFAVTAPVDALIVWILFKSRMFNRLKLWPRTFEK